MKRILIIASLAVVTAANAQTASSFHAVDFVGLTTTEPSPLKLSTSLTSGATVTIDGITFSIVDVFGVYKVATTGSLSSASSKSAPWSWKFDGLSGPQTVAGWEDNDKSNSISSGEVQNFEFKSLTATAGSTVVNGYHIRINGSYKGSNTFYAYGKTSAPVPEPASMAVIALGGLFLRRRKK